ncbi:hypothetical protein ABL78_2141 [Leptomonas seymouri]|uniref:F-box domain-containing protein n=1 Tax=Leptomonas seymouri TaxID=5684 RepID=A0A0N1PED6_LEPSE|nr:hypothetical protein ABL78_2141 [Leptomonas seymouri]|eukprot:KPI88762.1 hypothetical protein ABL78_2141 [Leptomonas seymouri]
MLPQFQLPAPDGAGSLNSSANFTCLNPPRYYEDLLSLVEIDRTTVSEAQPTAARPPSPAPLIFVSVPLPMVAAEENTLRLTEVSSNAGLARSPASKHATRRSNHRTQSSNYTPSRGSARFMHPSSDSSSEEDDGGDASIQFECTTASCTDRNGARTSTAASLRAKWGVVWMHIFPQHIAGYLIVRDVLELSLVCRAAQEAVRQPWVWRSLAVCHYAVHPASLERVFCFAAQEWVKDEAASGKGGNESYRRTTRLFVCEQHVASASNGPHHPSLASPPPTPLLRANSGEDVQVLTNSTSTAPWLAQDSTEALASENAVGASEEDGEDSNEVDESLGGELTSIASPQATCEDGNGMVNAVEAAIGEEAAMMDIKPCTTAEDVITPASKAATRAALAPGSSYLWQTAAASMLSPSSPISSPLPEGHREEGNALGHSAVAAAINTLPASPQRVTNAGSIAGGEQALDGLACLCAPDAAAGVDAAACCAPPCASARPQAPVPLLSSAPVHVAAVASAERHACLPSDVHEATTTVEQKSGGAKLPGHCRTGVRERLPPPSPAQLDSSATNDMRPLHEGTRGGGEAAQAAPFSPTLRCHPSYMFVMTTDMSLTNVDGRAAVPSASAAADAAAACSSSRSPLSAPMYCYTLCRATAERTLLKNKPEFPWQLFTRYLYTNRVQASLLRWAELSKRAREELCRGAWDSAYGSLSHIIHALFQQGSCRGAEHLLLLAQTLVRRASLCRHRGHVHLLAAFTDLSTAALLCPDSVAPSDVMEMCARDELATLSPETWMQSYEDAAQIASPVALLGAVAQVPFLFPQHRTLCFCSALTAYMRAYRTLGQPLNYLLCRAAEWATPGTEEELLVRALRETTQARQCPSRSSSFYVSKACATVDYALSLMPLQVRCAVDSLTNAWVRDCFHSEDAVRSVVMKQWASTAPEATTFARTTALEVRWLAWLTCEVQTFVYKELTDTLPSRAALTSVVLSLTAHDRADGLVRIAAQYANYEIRPEALFPSLPPNAHRRRITQYVLHNALRLRPLHPTAALLLSRVYAVAEEEEGEVEGDASMASTILTDCIHRWAKRFSLLELNGPSARLRSTPAYTTTPYLHRRERSPEVCFIPSELLVGRNRCLHTVVDLAEATEQHQSLSYPYQMRAAVAMDRGYHLAAILEMGRIMKLSLDLNDVALRVRLLQDALELPSLRTPRGAGEAVAVTTPIQSSAVFSRTSSFEGALRMPDAGSPSASFASLPRSPSLDSSSQLRPMYRAWLARMRGLLTLLRPPEAFFREGDEDDGTGLAGPLGGGQPGGRLLFSRDLPSMTTREYGNGHVSRVASMAFIEAEGDAVWSTGGGAVDAAHVRAFVEDLVSCFGAAPAASRQKEF